CPQRALAADPGRYLWRRRAHPEFERRTGLWRGLAGPGGNRRLSLGSRSLRRHHSDRGIDRGRPQGQGVLRQVVRGLPETLSRSPRIVPVDQRAGGALLVRVSLLYLTRPWVR